MYSAYKFYIITGNQMAQKPFNLGNANFREEMLPT